MVEYETFKIIGEGVEDKWWNFRGTIKFKGGYMFNPHTNTLEIDISKRHSSYKLVKDFARKLNREYNKKLKE